MITTTLRIEPTLYEKIVKQSDKDDRSINKEINYIIKAYLEMINWNNRKQRHYGAILNLI